MADLTVLFLTLYQIIVSGVWAFRLGASPRFSPLHWSVHSQETGNVFFQRFCAEIIYKIWKIFTQNIIYCVLFPRGLCFRILLMLLSPSFSDQESNLLLIAELLNSVWQLQCETSLIQSPTYLFTYHSEWFSGLFENLLTLHYPCFKSRGDLFFPLFLLQITNE